MQKKQIPGELKLAVKQLKAYLQEEKYFDPDEIIPLSKKNKRETSSLDGLRAKVENCLNCRLGKSRIKAVFGEGNPKARIMFVGEGPGYDEDRAGMPFVGKAGQLLTKIIQAIKFTREDVYIANIVKCHPMSDPSKPEMRGNDRPPSEDETAACLPYLLEQIDIIKPEVICTLGNSAAKTLLRTEETISRIRGKIFEFRGRKLIPTFHPAALLRNPNLKADVWKDMKLMVAILNKKESK